jgi:hypothetical protein
MCTQVDCYWFVVQNIQSEHISVHSCSLLDTAVEITCSVGRSFESCWGTSAHYNLTVLEADFILEPFIVHEIGVACEVCSGWSEYVLKKT